MKTNTITGTGKYTHRLIDAHGHTGAFSAQDKCHWGHLLNSNLYLQLLLFCSCFL